MKGEWEHAIKPQSKLGTAIAKEYIVGIPAEAFGRSSLDEDSREPLIKKGRIHFKRYVKYLDFTALVGPANIACVYTARIFKKLSVPHSLASIVSWMHRFKRPNKRATNDSEFPYAKRCSETVM